MKNFVGIKIGNFHFFSYKTGEGGRTTLTGVEVGMDLTTEDKIWRMFRAVGDMAFACAYSPILIEIQVRKRNPYIISNFNSI